jgi:quercetin dioxygenase-like cupin family protein
MDKTNIPKSRPLNSMKKNTKYGQLALKQENQIMREKTESQVTSLNAMINYQDGSVVSRTLIGKKTGTVTLFAFDAGQGLSEHTTPYDALVYLLHGKAEITISGNVYHLQEGEMIIMPANEPHALKAEKAFKMMLIMIKS